MRPRLQRHSTVRHRPEHLSEGLRGCTGFLLKHYLPALVQHAIPTPTIPQIQSHDVFLLRKVPALLLCHSDTLPHSRSPFYCALERVITGSLSHPAWRPAFSSHLLTSVNIARIGLTYNDSDVYSWFPRKLRVVRHGRRFRSLGIVPRNRAREIRRGDFHRQRPTYTYRQKRRRTVGRVGRKLRTARRLKMLKSCRVRD